MANSLLRWLSRVPYGRTLRLRMARWVRAQVSCPDAYADLARWIRQLRPYAILDIGSYVGETIDHMLLEHAIPVHGFEPTARSFERLADRFANHPLVKVHRVALSHRNGSATFYSNRNAQTNSLLENDLGNLLAFPEYTQHLGTETVPLQTLDSWASEWLSADQTVVVKCDVQGAEGAILDGGVETFRHRVVAFLSEAQIAPMYVGQADFCELHGRLRSLGFVLHNIYPCYRDAYGRAVQTDALWVKASMLGLPQEVPLRAEGLPRE